MFEMSAERGAAQVAEFLGRVEAADEGPASEATGVERDVFLAALASVGRVAVRRLLDACGVASMAHSLAGRGSADELLEVSAHRPS